MKFDKRDLLLYAVTDRSWLGEQTLSEQVEEALRGGATFVQLREKDIDDAMFLAEATEVQALCRQYQVPFVINDNVKLACEIGADGVHVGQRDMEAGNVRALIGENKILGVSVQTVEQALLAERRGADYLGVGAVFQTSSKADADNVSFDTLKDVCKAVRIPVVAIGGIGRNNVSELRGSGIRGVAVISAIFGADDIENATAELRTLTERVVER